MNDGDPVSLWSDSSGNGHDATQSGGARPIFKNDGAFPVVRFSSSLVQQFLNLAIPISGAAPWTMFVVMKPAPAPLGLATLANNVGSWPTTLISNSDGNLYYADNTHYRGGTNPAGVSAFHIFGSGMAGGGFGANYIDGVVQASGPVDLITTGAFDVIGKFAGFSDGDIAELFFFNRIIQGGGSGGSFERDNLEKYLGTKYGIAVPGGTAVDPTTVSGLVGWWKADSLLGPTIVEVEVSAAGSGTATGAGAAIHALLGSAAGAGAATALAAALCAADASAAGTSDGIFIPGMLFPAEAFAAGTSSAQAVSEKQIWRAKRPWPPRQDPSWIRNTAAYD